MKKFTIETKEAVAQCLKDNWAIMDIVNQYNISPDNIRIINKRYGCNRSVPSPSKLGYLTKNDKKNQDLTMINKCSNQNIDEYNVELNLDALNYFEENTKYFFHPNLYEIKFKNKPPKSIVYFITYKRVLVNYIYNGTEEFFKFKFVNDFYKNQLEKKDCEELFRKKNVFEKIKDNNNNYCIFDLDRFLNNLSYKEAVNIANITKVAPKI